MTRRTSLVLIAAVASNGIIGRSGRLPWHLPGDLAHFRKATLGRPVIMGRSTFVAIGRPLPGRETIVLSADPTFAPPGVTTCRSLDDALAEGDRSAARLGAGRIMVAGGGTVYRATMPKADVLLITAVEGAPEGDTFFPAIDGAQWRCASRSALLQGPDDTLPYRIEHWERRQGCCRPDADHEAAVDRPASARS